MWMDGKMAWFGEHDERTLAQMRRCVGDERVLRGVICADGHVGFGVPIGGVIAYRDAVSPSAVGFDIACGILAVRTNAALVDVRPSLPRLLDDIARTVAFGLGRSSPVPVNDVVLDDPAWKEVAEIAPLRAKAAAQLGTVGSGNHFIDILTDEDDRLWIAAHFGSRGLGHGICSGFLNLAANRPFDATPPRESMDAPPVVIPASSSIGAAYLRAMRLAGDYAYAGREYVVGQVLGLLGARPQEAVHNHHNFAWTEEHGGERLFVVRKGATPAWPGQTGFVGGSMGDIAAIVQGVDTPEAALALRSTIHGAGRILSRTAAKGKHRKGHEKVKGLVTRQDMAEAMHRFGALVRGGDVDEAPQVYRPLKPVLEAHAGSLAVLHRLRPVGVVMAGADIQDPYKE